LHVASAYDRPLVVRWLLSAGADAAAVCKESCGAVHMAAHAGSVGSLSLLAHTAAGHTTSSPCGVLRCTALQLAVEEEQLAAVNTLLAAHADVSSRDVDGCSALHWAAEIGNTDVVAALLRAGAVVDCQDHAGWTPMHLAVWNEHYKVCIAYHASSMCCRTKA
jgi:hypothetical protein